MEQHWLDHNPCKVIDHLFIGSKQSSKNKSKIDEENITHIVVAGRGLKSYFEKELEYIYLDVEDWIGEDMISHFDNSNKYIADAISSNGNVLVHCAAGVSRSATIVISYLLKVRPNFTVETAKEFLKNVRPCINPGANFIRQLELYWKWNCTMSMSRNVLWNLEFFSKKDKGITLSRSVQGLPPNEFLTEKHYNIVCSEFVEVPSVEIELFYCKACIKGPHDLYTMDIKPLFSSLNIGYEVKVISHYDCEGKRSIIEKVKEEEEEEDIYFSSSSSLSLSSSSSSLSSSYILIEKMTWMKDVVMKEVGLIFCNTCGEEIGIFNWKGAEIDGVSMSPLWAISYDCILPETNIVVNKSFFTT